MRHCFGGGQFFFAFAQRVYGLFAFGDVAEEAAHIPYAVQRDHGRGDVGVDARAVFAQNGNVGGGLSVADAMLFKFPYDLIV